MRATKLLALAAIAVLIGSETVYGGRYDGLVDIFRGAARQADPPPPPPPPRTVAPTPRPQVPQVPQLDAIQRQRQALHSWDGQGRAGQWQERGINDPLALQRHLDDVRVNYHMHEPLRDARMVYGQYSDGSRQGGTILIDDPFSPNGGTAFPHPDLYSRFYGVVRND